VRLWQFFLSESGDLTLLKSCRNADSPIFVVILSFTCSVSILSESHCGYRENCVTSNRYFPF
jgi:hypothetical protein